jgi:hypothetical protein
MIVPVDGMVMPFVIRIAEWANLCIVIDRRAEIGAVVFFALSFKISKEMSSLYLGLDVFCLVEARILQLDMQFLPWTTGTAVKLSSLQILGIRPRIGRTHQVQNTTTTLFANVILNNLVARSHPLDSQRIRFLS